MVRQLEALRAQWAVFFERAGFSYRRQPLVQHLAADRFYTPDFYVERLGFVTVSVDPSIYIDASPHTPARVRDQFSDFFEFASGSKEWCYWLGGVIPFFSLCEVHERIAFTLDDLADPVWLHKAEVLHQEWPARYAWYKLRRHPGLHRLPITAQDCGGVLARLHGSHFKTAVLDAEAFSAFNHKAALIAARSAGLGHSAAISVVAATQ